MPAVGLAFGLALARAEAETGRAEDSRGRALGTQRHAVPRPAPPCPGLSYANEAGPGLAGEEGLERG